MSSIPQKHCPKCKKDLPLTREYFYPNRSTKNGFSSWCIQCHLILKHESDKRRAIKNGTRREELPEGFKRCSFCKEIKEASRDIFSTNPKSKDGLQSFCKRCGAKQQKEYRQNNPEKVQVTENKRDKGLRRASARERYASDPERHRVARKDYVKRHPEVVKASNARIRSIRRNALGSYTSEELAELYRLQKGKCWWCGCELNGKYEPDHRIPLSRGGTNYINNIAISCKKCNRAKSKSLPHERFGRLI